MDSMMLVLKLVINALSNVPPVPNQMTIVLSVPTEDKLVLNQPVHAHPDNMTYKELVTHVTINVLNVLIHLKTVPFVPISELQLEHAHVQLVSMMMDTMPFV